MTERIPAATFRAQMVEEGKIAPTDGPRATTRAKRRDVEGPIHIGILQMMALVLPPGTPIHHSANEMDINLGGLPGEYRALVRKAISRAQDKAKAKGMRPGWPDLQALYKGKLLTFEVKAPGKHPTEEQMACGESIAAAGGRCYCS